jgi:hypothetical protein
MHWINWPLRRAKVDERVLWWSGGQTCYQVPLSTINKLVREVSPATYGKQQTHLQSIVVAVNHGIWPMDFNDKK